MENTDILDENNSEWQRSLRVEGKVGGQRLPFTRVDRIMCCPEDIKQCSQCKPIPDQICGDCEVPLCRDCLIAFKFSPRVIPLGLCNDNLFGYTTSLIAKYKVRWLEAAIVSPVWTSMMIFYIEGDEGHLFDEQVQAPRWRTSVRGSCVSYMMPWEDVIRE